MKQGRNDSCPCGSGKKYKKCCYTEEPNTVSENSLISGDEDVLIEKEEYWLNAITNFRRFTLDKKPHFKEYYKMRKLHGEIVDAMLRYHDSGKFKQKTETGEISKVGATLHLIESDFDLNTRVGAQAFYDTQIYKIAANVNCITEDFIRNHRYKKPEKIELLNGMMTSKLGLFEITDTDMKEGYAYLKDVFTGDEYRIVDIGMSGNQKFGEFYIYTRIITCNGISFGTGLNFIFDKTDGFIKNHIAQHKKDYNPVAEFLRFTQLYKSYSKCPDKIRVVNPVR